MARPAVILKAIPAVLVVVLTALAGIHAANAQNYQPRLKKPLRECYHNCLDERFHDCFAGMWGNPTLCPQQRIECLRQCGVTYRGGPLPD